MKTKKTTPKTEGKTEKKTDGKAKKDGAKESTSTKAARTKSTKKVRTAAASATPEEPPPAAAPEPASAQPQPDAPLFEPTANQQSGLVREAAEATPASGAAEPSAEASADPVEAGTETTADEAAPAGTVEPIEPRLPPVGTVIKKVDRSGAVRCECTVEPEGKIRYRNTLYTSLSGAAAAAAGDLGLTSKSLNGWAWWGLTKPARKEGAPRASSKDPVKALDKAYSILRDRINRLLSDELPDELRKRLDAAVRERAEALAAVARAAEGGRAA